MSPSSMPTNPAVQNPSQPRKSYHTPRLEDFGAVNELTRSGSGESKVPDSLGYSSLA